MQRHNMSSEKWQNKASVLENTTLSNCKYY